MRKPEEIPKGFLNSKKVKPFCEHGEDRQLPTPFTTISMPMPASRAPLACQEKSEPALSPISNQVNNQNYPLLPLAQQFAFFLQAKPLGFARATVRKPSVIPKGFLNSKKVKPFCEHGEDRQLPSSSSIIPISDPRLLRGRQAWEDVNEQFFVVRIGSDNILLYFPPHQSDCV